jgi:7-keto-8-aminopelargonate synthetase-like enzyme
VTHALLDELAHPSLQDAARFLDCPALEFRHADPEDLRSRLRRLPPGARPLVLTDGLFGRDGTVAPLAAYLGLLPARGRILVDDAHALGVLGSRGRGSIEACGVRDARLIRTATLSKAFGSFGGVILADEKLARRVIDRSHAFPASTPIPLPAAAAALAAGRLIQSDAAMRERLRANVRRVKEAFSAGGLEAGASSAPILAVMPASAWASDRLRRRLMSRGIYPSLIRYPGAPKRGYFRFAISSEHDTAQLDALAGGLLADAHLSVSS